MKLDSSVEYKDNVNSEIFTRISIKRHVCDIQNPRPGHDLHISVNNRVISPYRECFIFTKLLICEVSRK